MSTPSIVQVSKTGNGRVLINGTPFLGTYKSTIGAKVVFTAVPESGDAFVNWTGSGPDSTQNPLPITLDAPSGTICANFKASGGCLAAVFDFLRRLFAGG